MICLDVDQQLNNTTASSGELMDSNIINMYQHGLMEHRSCQMKFDFFLMKLGS